MGEQRLNEYRELSAKLKAGLDIAYNRLLDNRAKENGSLTFGTADGKVYKVKARKLKRLPVEGTSLTYAEETQISYSTEITDEFISYREEEE